MIALAWTAVTGVIGKAWIYLAIVGAIIAAVTTVLFGARQAGRAAERVDQLRRSLDAENERKNLDLAIATGGDAERQRMRSAFSRD